MSDTKRSNGRTMGRSRVGLWWGVWLVLALWVLPQPPAEARSLAASQNQACQPPFNDIPCTHWARGDIEKMLAAGITSGCGGGNYCPLHPVTREQMAIFLLRGINGGGYTPPPATGARFADVPASHWAAAWIERLAATGITIGCGGGNYCPNTPLTRAQMAIFLLRAKHGSDYQPPPATGARFGDVPASHWAATWIEQLAREGITGGCGGGNYCPNASVNREQMAAFLVRTFDPTGRLVDLHQEQHETATVTNSSGKAILDVDSFDKEIWLHVVDTTGKPVANWNVDYAQREGGVEIIISDPTGVYTPTYIYADLIRMRATYDPQTGKPQSLAFLPQSTDSQSRSLYRGQPEQILIPQVAPIVIAGGVLIIKAVKIYKTYKIADAVLKGLKGVRDIGSFVIESHSETNLTTTAFEFTYGELKKQVPSVINVAGAVFVLKKDVIEKVEKTSRIITVSDAVFTEVKDAVIEEVHKLEDKVALDIIDYLLGTVADDDTIIRFSVNHFAMLLATVTPGSFRLTLIEIEIVDAPTSHQLTVNKTGAGSGTVTSSPAGINCGSACAASFSAGTPVTLTATPASGSTFAGWSGACSGTGTCPVTMSQARSVAATFNTLSSSAIQLEEDFSGRFAKWELAGSPLPRIVNVHGRQNVFDNNGDGWCSSNAASKAPINLADGVIIEADVYLQVDHLQGCWVDATIGLTNKTYANSGNCANDGFVGPTLAGLYLVGDACWAAPPEVRRHSYVSGYRIDSVLADNYVNAWRRLKIVVDREAYVDVYLDDLHIGRSQEPIDEQYRQNPYLLLGSRSSGYGGKAYMDNVIVKPYDGENRDQELNICDVWSAVQSGGAGTTIDNWDINMIPAGATFDIRFDTFTIPDKLIIEYAGSVRLNTGWRGSSSYEGNPLYPGGIAGPGSGQVDNIFTRNAVDTFNVTVIGHDPKTEWRYEVRCRLP